MKATRHHLWTLAALALAGATQASAQQLYWDTHGGTVTVSFDAAALQAQGLQAPTGGPAALPVRDEQGSGMHFAGPAARIEAMFRANLRTNGALQLTRIGGGQVRLVDLVFVPALRNDGSLSGCVNDGASDMVAFELRAAGDARALSQVNSAALRATWGPLELRIASGWAQTIGLPAAAGARVGTITIETPMTPGSTFYTVNGDDCGCGVDQGDTAASSARLPMPARAAGAVETAGDQDAFALELQAGVRYTFRTERLLNGADTIIQLRDADGTTVIAEDDDGNQNENLASQLIHTATRTGTHYLFVRDYAAGNTGGRWELVVESNGAPAPGPGPAPGPSAGDDHGNDAAGATRINLNAAAAGRITAGDQDWFKVDLAAGQTYVLRTGDLSQDMDTILALFDRDGTSEIANNDDSNQGAGGLTSWISHTVQTAGTYYLRVTHYDATAQGTYAVYAEGSGPPAPPLPPNPPPPNPGSNYSHVTAGGNGPDVIVGDLHDLARYGRSNGITAFAVGTTSCNVGTRNLLWHSQTNEHPVIGSNAYRLKDGRLEQVGMSWLKHGFFALSERLCFNDCQATGGDELGVHCSDPYSAGLNGSQSNLGPRSEVNPSTGVFPYPYTAANNPDSTLGLRLQIKDADLDPARNAGAIYWVEGQYIAQDDARAGNDDNNVSARRVRITGGTNNWNIEFMPGEPTRRQKPAIEVWRDIDQDVVLQGVSVQGDGLFDVAYKVTRNADGSYHYEFAIWNMNSDRAARSFSVPVPAGANVTNVGFHDVDHHSGEPYSGADWTSARVGGALTWSTATFAQDRNANALRWGTMYNFRFDCDRAPAQGLATLGLFKPGAAADPTVNVMAPGTGGAADTTAPTFAGVTGATALGGDSIDVSWSAGSDDRSAPAALEYLVYAARTAGGQDFAAAPAASIRGQTRALVTGLQSGTEYFFVVRARDEAGNVDQNRVERSARTDRVDAAAPTFAGATALRSMGQTELGVEWAAAQDDVSAPGAIKYRVYLATAAGGQDFTRPTVETSAGALRVTLGGLTAGTSYWAVVRAVDEAGREDQNRVELSAQTDPQGGGGLPITGPAVEIDLHRTSAPVARPGERVQFTVMLRNTTQQAQTVTGDIILQAENGNRYRLGRTQPITIQPARSNAYALNLPIGANAAPARYTLVITITDATGGMDIAAEAFEVGAAATP